MSRYDITAYSERLLKKAVVVRMCNPQTSLFGTLFKVVGINPSETLLWVNNYSLEGDEDYVFPVEDFKLVAGDVDNIEIRLTPPKNFNVDGWVSQPSFGEMLDYLGDDNEEALKKLAEFHASGVGDFFFYIKRRKLYSDLNYLQETGKIQNLRVKYYIGEGKVISFKDHAIQVRYNNGEESWVAVENVRFLNLEELI